MDSLHKETLERIQYLLESCNELDTEDKVTQLNIVFEAMNRQQDGDYLVQEIAALAYYSLHDKEATIHFNISYSMKGK